MPRQSEGKMLSKSSQHNVAIGFEKIMQITRLLDNPHFGDFLDECEERHTVCLKVTSQGVIFRSGTLKVVIPLDTCVVQFPTCQGCFTSYLGHHRLYCPSCANKCGRGNGVVYRGK